MFYIWNKEIMLSNFIKPLILVKKTVIGLCNYICEKKNWLPHWMTVCVFERSISDQLMSGGRVTSGNSFSPTVDRLRDYYNFCSKIEVNLSYLGHLEIQNDGAFSKVWQNI